MAFNIQNFAVLSSSANRSSMYMQAYKSSTETLAAITASGYFNEVRENFAIGDIIFIKASDGNNMYKVNGVNPNVTITLYDTASGISLPQGNMLIGDAGGAASNIVASAVGSVLVGNGTTAVSQKLDAASVADFAGGDVVGGITTLYKFPITGGATKDYDITLTYKSTIIDVWAVNKGNGGAGDTLQLKNAASVITDTMDASGVNESVVRMSTLNSGNALILAGGTLRVTQTDAAGADAPAANVYALAVRTA